MHTTKSAAGLAAAAVAAVSFLLAACSPTPAADGAGPSVDAVRVSADRDADPSTWCGDKDLTIGVADGVNNAARKQMLKVVENEVAKCPQLNQEVLYVNADGDQQKASSDISALVSRGVDVLLVNPDFGQAELPALRAATQAGVVVIAMVVDPGGQPGVDYAAKIYQDGGVNGEAMAEWMASTLNGNGNVVHLGGVAGNPFSGAAHEGISEVFSRNPGLKLVNDEPVVTNWSAAGTQSAMTGLLASNPDIDGIITESGEVAEAVAGVYTNAGLPVPVIATQSTTNAMGCSYEKLAATGGAYPIFALDEVFDNLYLALRAGVMSASGREVAADQIFELSPTVDTTQNRNPVCKNELPVGADPSAPLTDAEITELFQ